MRYTVAAAALAGVAAAQQWGPPSGPGSWGPPASNGTAPVYVTEVVTAFTTYCPVATAITHAGQTYTVSSATTLTITNCPGGCTITKAVSSSSTPPAVVTSKSSSSTPAIVTSKSTPAAPVGTGSTSSKPAGTAPAVTGSSTKPAGTASASGTTKPSASSSPITPYTGAGVQVQAGVAGVLAVAGLIAAL